MIFGNSRPLAIGANNVVSDLKAPVAAHSNGSVHRETCAVLESRQGFSAILDTLDQQVVVIDAQGSILWVNNAWKLFSVENGGSPDQTWRNVNYLEVCSASATRGDTDAASAEAGIIKVVSGVLPLFIFEYPCHSQKEQRWFMMSVKPLVGQGTRHFVLSHLNITKRKLAELEQKKFNDLYEETQRIGMVGSWKLDLREGTNGTRHWSKEMYRIHGFSLGKVNSVKEADIYNAMHPGDRSRVKNARGQSLVEERPFEIEYRVVTGDGCVKYLQEICATNFDAAGQPQSSVGTVQDITARKQAEKDISDFISFVSHELRTPLTSIRGSICLAKSGSVGEVPTDFQSLLEITYRNTERLMKLLDEILDADKLSSGTIKMHKKKWISPYLSGSMPKLKKVMVTNWV